LLSHWFRHTNIPDFLLSALLRRPAGLHPYAAGGNRDFTFDGQVHTISVLFSRDTTENCLPPVVEIRSEMWFQQDGTTANTARATMDLRQLFVERIISRNSQINWPPRSPDLSAPDYFLWG
jgi:hypothetical protein